MPLNYTFDPYPLIMTLRPYEKLIVWQEAFKLCLLIYRITRAFPKEERYGLISQMRRSSYSVPINIAEGNAKRSAKEKLHFFEIAKASLEELHCESRLSLELGYLNKVQFDEIDNGIHRVSYLFMKLRASLMT